MSEMLSRDGFEIVPEVLSGAWQEQLLATLDTSNKAGRRGVLAEPLVWQLAHSPAIKGLMSARLRAPARPVRAIFFDKSPETNWLVPWHQDLTIAVQETSDLTGYGPWTVKDGIPHVQPPAEVLASMLTIRLHLDDCDETNGALQVIPGSHRHGRLSASEIQEFRDKSSPHTCCLRAGDALLMKPLLLHASSQSQSSGHRRVLHIEYAALDLPAPLKWHEAA
jgi:hypothetical protein